MGGDVCMEFVQPIRDKKKIEAMKKILSASNNGKRDVLMFTMGINSALRISDILLLKISDVLDKKGKPKSFVELREGKTEKSKRFPIAVNVQKAIIEYLQGYDGDYDRPLFSSRKSNAQGRHKAISRQQAYEIINNAADVVSINEKIGTHTLRKTFAYHAYKAGSDISLIQQLLNHSSQKETLRYIGITQDQMDDVYINLNL
jgi:integrase